MAAVEVGFEPISDEELYNSSSKRKASGSPNVPYYLRNFLTILNHVLQNAHNSSLFSEEMLSLLQQRISGEERDFYHYGGTIAAAIFCWFWPSGTISVGGNLRHDRPFLYKSSRLKIKI